jgi:hypothetical protein
MTNADLRKFYEKLYFQEVEARERIHARLQLPLTLMLAIIGAIAFLLQNFDYQAGRWTALRVVFLFLLACGSITLILAMKWFVDALYNNEYYFLPDSSKTADYKDLLEETYKDYPQSSRLVADAMDKYLTDYYIEYAAFNTAVNDRRSAFIHRCTGAIIASAVLFIASFLAFYFGDLDRSRIKAATEVYLSKPVEVRVQDNRK